MVVYVSFRREVSQTAHASLERRIGKHDHHLAEGHPRDDDVSPVEECPPSPPREPKRVGEIAAVPPVCRPKGGRASLENSLCVFDMIESNESVVPRECLVIETPYSSLDGHTSSFGCSTQSLCHWHDTTSTTNTRNQKSIMHRMNRTILCLCLAAAAMVISPVRAFRRNKVVVARHSAVSSSNTIDSAALSIRGGSLSREWQFGHGTIDPNRLKASTQTKPQMGISRTTLIHLDVLVGVLYSAAFLVAPGRTLRTFFGYDTRDFDQLRPLWHLAVRMVAVNHLAYVAGLWAAPPAQAIKVATGFLTLGGIAVVYYGQIFLETATAFWSCTILTTLLLVAHWWALLAPEKTLHLKVQWT